MASRIAPLEYLERFAGGEALAGDATRGFVGDWVGHGVPDAQMAAWMGAVARRGLDDAARYAVTSELIASGDRLDLGGLGRTAALVSTGVLGDAVRLVAAPVLAALGVPVLCDAERAVGCVGGLSEQLGSLPGYRDPGDVTHVVAELRSGGYAVTGRLPIAPAVARLAALADVTASGRIPSLIAASATARALALGTPVACVHVPYGDAALVPDRDGADEVAATAVAFGGAWGRRVVCVLTEVPTLLAPALGHRLLVREAARVLRGGGSPALRAAALDVAEAVATASGLEGDVRESAGRALADGRARAAAVAWGERHGLAADALTGADAAGLAPHVREVAAGRDGIVGIASVLRLGEAVRRLGAGRLHADQAVDGGVGVAFAVAPGGEVSAGETVVTVYGRDAYLTDRAAEEVSAQVTVTGA